MRRVLLLAAAILLVVTVVAVQPASTMLAVDLDARRNLAEQAAIDVDYSSGESDHLYELIVSFMPADMPDVLPNIVIIDADGVPGRSSEINGLYDHIAVEMGLRGLEAAVTIESIEDMALPDPASIMVIGERAELNNETAAALMSWVSEGGRLICIGPGSLPFRQEIEDGEWTGPEDFLRVKYRELSYTVDEAEASAYAEALHLRSQAPLYAMEKEYLDNISAVTIGHLHHDADGDLVTASMVPIGDGRLVLFGGPMTSPAMVSGDSSLSWDIVQLYAGGALWSTGPPKFVSLPMSADARTGNLTITMDSIDAVVVMAYSLQPYVPAYGRTVVAAS